jgi:hypothetical protein
MRATARHTFATFALAVVGLALASSSALAIKGYMPGASFGGEGSGPGQFNEPVGVAVNQLTGLSEGAGDVYVADKGNDRIQRFSPAGVYEAQFNGSETPAKSFASPEWPAVDNSTDPLDLSAGDVYVLDTGHSVVDQFTAAGHYTGEHLTGTCESVEAAPACTGSKFVPFGALLGFAVDPSGNLWVHERIEGTGEPAGVFAEFSDTGVFLRSVQQRNGSAPGPIATDGLGNVYAVEPNERLVLKIDHETGENIGELGSSNSEGISDVALLPGLEEMLVDDGNRLALFGAFGQPDEIVQTTTGLSGSTGLSVGASGTAYASELAADDVHIFNLVVLPPEIKELGASEVGATEATVNAEIDPTGEPTNYRVEYGTGESYSSSTSEFSIGASSGPVSVSVPMSNLQPSATYHYRFVAGNSSVSAYGLEMQFRTRTSAAAGLSALPDDRAYELVSSPTSNANVYPPIGELKPPDSTHNVARAAASGEGVVYQGDPPAEGGSGSVGAIAGNTYVARRSSAGWTQTDIQLTEGQLYEGFSSELSVGVSDPESAGGRERIRISSAPAESPSCTRDSLFSYMSKAGSYQALVSSVSSSSRLSCHAEFGGGNGGTATVPQYSDILLQGGALTAEAIAPTIPYTYDLYDAVGDNLHLVSVLPDGEAATGARFVGNEPIQGSASRSNTDGEAGRVNGSPDDISADGSRVFWMTVEAIPHSEYLSPKGLYVRENDTQPQSPIESGECVISSDACTVQIDAKQPGATGSSGGGLFWAASSDGSKVFFTDESRLTVGSTAAPGEPDLYEYQLSPDVAKPGKLVDLTVDPNGGAHSDVQGVMSASDNGSYVYFVAKGVLSEKNTEGYEPVAGGANFYLLHNGVTTFIATADPDTEPQAGYLTVGDVRLDTGVRTAEATPDGHSLVFRSQTSLTGYDSHGLPEVFVYNADSARLACASCAPTGASPGRGVTPYGIGAALTVSADSDFLPRWMSDDGARVFFVTAQPLVPSDVNGLQDVYEWERPASGSEANNSCTLSSPDFSEENGGCVYLLSGGTSTDDAYFLDASANGDDVFFRSRGKLTPQAVNENMALYDARVEGGFSETLLACTGTGCQGVPSAPPIFATPSSVTFSGTGNFPAPAKAKPKIKAKTKKPAKCKAKEKRIHGKCMKKAKRIGAKHTKNGRKS